MSDCEEDTIWFNHLDGGSRDPHPSRLHYRGVTVEEVVSGIESMVDGDFETIICSSGAEALNHALKGVALRRRQPGSINLHQSASLPLRNAARWLRRQGWSIGASQEIVCFSIVDGDTGGIQEIPEAEVTICDATAAVGRVRLSMDGIDAMGFSIADLGALLIRPGLRLDPLIHGGDEQGGRRGGHVPRILLDSFYIPETVSAELDSALIESLQSRGFKVNAPSKRAPGIVNVALGGVSGEAVLIDLAMNGVIATSSGGCTSATGAPSASLMALGLSEDDALSSLRICISSQTTEEEMEKGCSILREVVDSIHG